MRMTELIGLEAYEIGYREAGKQHKETRREDKQ